MFLRQQNERQREIYTYERERQYPSKYSSFHNSRGFARMKEYHSSSPHSSIPSHMISQDGIIITNNLSQQLLDDHLSIVRRHWQRSKMTFYNKIEHIQTDLSSHTNMSVKKAIPKCQAALFKWVSKHRVR